LILEVKLHLIYLGSKKALKYNKQQIKETMKTTFPAKSQPHQERIEEIANIILKVGKDKIAFIILFGSFARGNWVFDRYSEGNAVYYYASDYDILIITKAKRKDDENGISSFDLERKIKHEINLNEVVRHDHNVQFVIEPINYVNSELEKGRYFFSDIRAEGILLYDSGEFQLSKPKILTEKEITDMARDDYNYWFNGGLSFFDTALDRIKKNDLIKAAFQLHQATESFYNCALLVITSYKPKSHDLENLNKLCAAQSNDFLTIFPLATKEQEECFKLLQKAYIDARYNKHYRINKEQLEYLISRVEILQDIVERVCKNKL
jgi:predicted nucleotidyltransferase/HEPN domain-containing protein